MQLDTKSGGTTSKRNAGTSERNAEVEISVAFVNDEMYQDIALNCFRYLGFKAFTEVDVVTIPEYRILIKAAELREVDMAYHIHSLAYHNFRVQAKKKAGKNKTKPVFSSFAKFFDYQKEIDKVLGKKDNKLDRLKRFIAERR